MSAIKELSWEPVRRGPIYCAPACGGQCTVAAYDMACSRAVALAEQLGPNWKPHVWENLGWHYCALEETGHWRVHTRWYKGSVTYTAFLGEPDSFGGKWAESAKTPRAAIEKVRRVAREALKDLQCLVDAGLVNSKDLYLRKRQSQKKNSKRLK